MPILISRGLPCMHYYGTRLSENISRREPEGYLLCLNVPVARTGTQDYLPEELGLSRSLSRRDSALRSSLASADLSSDDTSATGGRQSFAPFSFISVYRPEEEVFSPETVASFEGMPVTNDHPPDGVDVSNIRALQKGHAHNIRRGSGDESDLLLADLIITDPHLIRLIMEEGKREISCGYTYELHEENGRYIQRKIRGNHVAVVDAGRAGPRVCIKDHKPERRISHMKKSLVKKLVRMAKDGDPEAIEAVAELLEEVAEEVAEGEASTTAGGGSLVGSEVIRNEQAPQCGAATVEGAEEVIESPAAVVETPEGTTVVVDEATLGEVLSRLDQIISLLTPAASDEDPVEEIAEAVEEAVEAAAAAEEAAEEIGTEELPIGTSPAEVAALVEEIMEPALSEVLEPEEEPALDECGEEEPQVTADALRAALTAIRPALARMPKKQRGKVAADIAAKIRKQTARRAGDGKTYAALANASRSRPAGVTADLGRRIMENRNPNYMRK